VCSGCTWPALAVRVGIDDKSNLAWREKTYVAWPEGFAQECSLAMRALINPYRATSNLLRCWISQILPQGSAWALYYKDIAMGVLGRGGLGADVS
jgi:hypothetical protein